MLKPWTFLIISLCLLTLYRESKLYGYNLEFVGIELHSILGFMAAAAISFRFIDKKIQDLHDSILRREGIARDTTGLNKQNSEEDWNRNGHFFNELFEKQGLLSLRKGAKIGQLERLFYIYAMMNPNGFDLIAAIVILKAFFGWIDVRNLKVFKNGLDLNSTQINMLNVELYYAYIFGNLLSLGSGILLGHLAIVVARSIDLLFSSADKISYFDAIQGCFFA